MEILNYTGKDIGLTNELGNPGKILPSNGNAHFSNDIEFEKLISVDGLPIYLRKYTKVLGLPKQDPNREKIYIVSEEIALQEKRTRFDLVVGIDPIKWEDMFFYKLVNYV